MTHAHAVLFWVLAGLYVLIEWYLPRSKVIAANSVLEIVANAIAQIPAVGALVKPLTTKVITSPPPIPAVLALDDETGETVIAPSAPKADDTDPGSRSAGVK